eukprot:6235230-Alexandrium_andersonii.AAC.1
MGRSVALSLLSRSLVHSSPQRVPADCAVPRARPCRHRLLWGRGFRFPAAMEDAESRSAALTALVD